MNYDIDQIFKPNISKALKEEYSDILFSKYIIPNISSLHEVTENLFYQLKKTGTKFKLKWYDRYHNSFHIVCFNKGPWFLVQLPNNAITYGEPRNDTKYYELPMNYLVRQFLDNEKGLLNDGTR